MERPGIHNRHAETCPDFDSAANALRHAPAGMPFIILLTDARNRRTAVFERDERGVIVRSPVDGIVTTDNCQWGVDASKSGPDQAIRRHAPCMVRDLQAALRDPDVLLACNLYSVIFDYRNNRLYLASGRVPAAKHVYRRYPLFSPPPSD